MKKGKIEHLKPEDVKRPAWVTPLPREIYDLGEAAEKAVDKFFQALGHEIERQKRVHVLAVIEAQGTEPDLSQSLPYTSAMPAPFHALQSIHRSLRTTLQLLRLVFHSPKKSS